MTNAVQLVTASLVVWNMTTNPVEIFITRGNSTAHYATVTGTNSIVLPPDSAGAIVFARCTLPFNNAVQSTNSPFLTAPGTAKPKRLAPRQK